MKNNGKKLEDLVRYIYQEMSNISNNTIEVKNNVKITGKSGVKHQIDVYYEFEQNDIVHKVIIECKDWNKKVGKDRISVINDIKNDIPNSIGVIVSKCGFQSGAKELADYYGIILMEGTEVKLLSRTIKKKLEIFLPKENTKGDPFWCIMESVDGNLSGNYICLKENTVSLFVSKKSAEEASKKFGGVVRGVSQKHLNFITNLNRNSNLELCIHLFDYEMAIKADFKLITDYYLYD